MSYQPVHVEIVTKIESKVCKIQNLLERQGINQFRVMDVRGTQEGKIGHMVKIPQSQLDMIEGKTPFDIVHTGKEDVLLWFESAGCDVCTSIVSRDSFLVSGGSLEKNQVLYRFIAQSMEVFQDIVSELEKKGFEPIVRKVEKYRSNSRVLTEKQDLVLWHAFKAGFFDYPRKVNSIELSKRLGIVPSTFSEIIRRGFRRLLESYYQSE